MTQSPALDAPPAIQLRASRLVSRTPFYYGWVIMLVATVMLIMTSPGQTYTVAIFIEQFISDLGISRTMVSTLYTAGTLMGSLALPMVGRRIDRHGARSTMVVITLLFGLACIYMGFLRGPIMLLFGFTAIRMLGQGSLSLVGGNAINQWWVRRRGAVIGISGVLIALLGVGTFPNFINWIIPQIGWRQTYIVLGLILVVVMAPLAYTFIRNRPEEYGLPPDGRPVDEDADGNEIQEVLEINWTPSEAMHTSAFWVVVLGLGSISMLSTGLTFHTVSIFADNGLSATAAAAVFVPVALTSAIVNLSSGILVDRIPVRILLITILFLQVVALWMAQILTGYEMAIAYGLILGTLFGMMRTVSMVVWPTYFGRRYLGSITGITSSILIASSALGPMPLGIARDMYGSYNSVLTIFAVLPLVLGIAAFFIRRPQKRPQLDIAAI